MRNIRFTVSDARRWLSLFLVCCIILCGLGGIHQRAQAVVVVDDAIVAIVIAALAAMGITFTMTGGYQTVRDWISDKIIESGIDFSGVKYGASSVGTLLLNNVFVRRIAAFATYIKAELGLLDNGEHVIFSSGVTIGDIVTYPASQWQFARNEFEDKYMRFYADRTVYGIFLRDGDYFRLVMYDDSPFNGSYLTPFQDVEYDDLTWHAAKEYDQTSFYYNSGQAMYLTYYPEMVNYVSYEWTLTELLDYLSGKTAELRQSLTANTGVVSIPDDITIGTQGGVLSLPVPWGQSMATTLTDIPGLVLSDELAGNTTLELEDASAVEDQVSDTATAEQPFVSSSARDYQSPGLSSVFPFCIPFDLYEFFECLAADPEAPEISWRFYVPGVCDEQIEIDLSQFDTVAQIVRTMELLAFIVGLALVTREKFLRG